ncbi:hypothetical protein LPJ61_003722 [Coemansia biformis]|uniref:WD40 repeat-like protein n=1 Tax=Coemansia biformis TaxID=1286918 RepID=A0A9W7YBM3_9FUNG|nr:hypothetical protein LPJ61_003722 [Coemansia biformis]
MKTPRIRHKLASHTGSANVAVFDTTGDYVFSGGQDKRIVLSNAGSGQPVQSYEGHGWAVQGIAVSADGGQMASCGGDRLVFVWDIGTAQISRKLVGHQQRVDCVAVNASGSVVASGSFDKTVCIWDLRAAPRTPLQVLRESRDGVSSLAMTDSEIISGSIDGCVRTYDMRMGRMLEDSLGSPVVAASIADRAGRLLVVGCMDSTVQLLDRRGGNGSGSTVVATFTGHRCAEYRIRCDASDAVVASGSEDGFVYVWSAVCGGGDGDSGGGRQHASRLAGHAGIVNGVMLHPQSGTGSANDGVMVSAGSDGNVIVWE